MNALFVAWQQPSSGEWIPVAKLERKNEQYYFSYTQGVFRARGFQLFGRMDDLTATYKSTTLFPTFGNRVISKSRPEFADYLRWLGQENLGDDTMSILALTGGIRGTDSIELFRPPYVSEDGQYCVQFFARSLSHLPETTIKQIGSLRVGSKLLLMKDSQNTFDALALALRTDTPPVLVGYCPKYYVRDLSALLDTQSGLEVHVKCVNIDAPLNMRLLCSVAASVPPDFSPLQSTEDFQPVVRNVPEEWDKLNASFEQVLHA